MSFTAIQTLMSEHRLIESMLASFEVFGETLQPEASEEYDSIAKKELSDYLIFFRVFADKTHHGKEEDILFAALEKAGFARNSGPVGVMLAEHTEGRNLLSALSELQSQKSPWSQDDRNKVFDTINTYSFFLRNHIHKEDTILFQMAASHLKPELQDWVNHHFTSFDEAPSQLLKEAEVLKIANRLANTHIAQEETSCGAEGGCGGCSCGH